MSIKLKGSSDGSVSFDAPADTSPSGSDITLTLPTSAGSANQFLKNSGTAGELEYSSIVEDSSGRVGIGETSPGSYDSGARNLVVGSTGSTGILIKAGTSSYSNLYFGDGTGAASYRGTVAYNHSQDSLRFGTAGQERVRIDSSGMVNVKSGDLRVTGGEGISASLYLIADEGDDNADGWRINSNQDANDLTISNNVSGSYADLATFSNAGDFRVGTGDNMDNGKIAILFTTARNGISLRPSSSILTQNYLSFSNSAGQTTGFIQQNGTTTVTYSTSSDYRLKENIVDLDGAITRVKQLAPKRFNFIGESDRTVDGFLAHEAQTVVPEAISGTHNGVEVWKEGQDLPEGVSVGDNKLDEDGNTIPDYQGIDQSKLVPLLTAALQEAIAKIETLETKVAALEAA